MEQIYSTGDVSRILGVQSYKIAYAIVTGQVPEPSFRFLNNRCFTLAELRRVAEYFAKEIIAPIDSHVEGEDHFLALASGRPSADSALAEKTVDGLAKN